MEFDDLLVRHFGTAEIAAISLGVTNAGTERIRFELGLETDRGRSFALWALLHIWELGPDLNVAFESEADREAARNFMDLAAEAGPHA